MAITFTLQIGFAYENGVESRVTAQAKVQQANYGRYDQAFLSKFTFRRWDNFQEWIALDGVDASMANGSFLSILLSGEDQIEIR